MTQETRTQFGDRAMEVEEEALLEEVELEDLEEEEEDLPLLQEAMDSTEKALFAGEIADSIRASDIIVLDLRDLTIIADFFLICTGKSSIQIRAIADKIEEKLRERGIRKLRVEGYQDATWILLDYGDVVMHVMAAEQRAFYDLEGFWSDAPQLELNLTQEPIGLS